MVGLIVRDSLIYLIYIMSIVVLKRKSIRYQAKISGKGSKGFSINGGLRNQGWVGQTTLGRHLSKTPFRGNLPMGNGGCCGNYDVSILSGSNCCTNDPNIIKRSTMNTSPYILASVEHPTPVFIPNCTKGCLKNTDSSFIDFTPFIHSQGNYIKHKRNVHNREELCCPPTKSDEDKSKVCPCPDVSKDVNIQSSNEYTERGVLHKNGLPTHIHHHHAITKSSTVVSQTPLPPAPPFCTIILAGTTRDLGFVMGTYVWQPDKVSGGRPAYYNAAAKMWMYKGSWYWQVGPILGGSAAYFYNPGSGGVQTPESITTMWRELDLFSIPTWSDAPSVSSTCYVPRDHGP